MQPPFPPGRAPSEKGAAARLCARGADQRLSRPVSVVLGATSAQDKHRRNWGRLQFCLAGARRALFPQGPLLTAEKMSRLSVPPEAENGTAGNAKCTAGGC